MLINKFGSTMKLLQKRIETAYVVAIHANIDDLLYEQDSRGLQITFNLACTTSLIANVHYKPTEY